MGWALCVVMEVGGTGVGWWLVVVIGWDRKGRKHMQYNDFLILMCA
jgi:hypothetical protein